jgi:hypothetical protein
MTVLQAKLSWNEAYASANRLMNDVAEQQGFSVPAPQGFCCNPARVSVSMC